MRLIHLSDLHFGRDVADVTAKLLSALRELSPDLVVISGDFTQLATLDEFRKAQNFIEALPAPAFCVPGNHDVPAFDLVARFFSPYKKYKRFIHDDLCPVAHYEKFAIAGLNSARRALPHWNWANGAVSGAQREKLRHVFSGVDSEKWRICVLHHPIHKVDDMPLDVTVFGRKRALEALQELEVDLVLTGHVHHASILTRGDHLHQTVYVSASTALSSRKRGGQENGFNVIDFSDDDMCVAIYTHTSEGFVRSRVYDHRRL